ncbi:hypothetical protein A1Q2_01589 [Trichosporon asahii var. asahii CBS 8904]|uniref:DH domain-containing protein n=1 Tax=Trichosporon asahii var. asahii (strain CBS 8904) TaxID=1220162 RepID=K1WT73_TRIAC|nr:hypothetical protein A1Q2_01589 [Trichosporon asahii var. asahii CBS 8904]
MAPIGTSPFRPRSRSGHANRSPSPPPLPPKSNNADAASSTGSATMIPSRSSRRAFLCDLIIDSNATGQHTNAMLSQLGQPLERPNCLPRAAELPQPQNSYADDIMAMSAAGWTASKQEEMDRRLQSLMEELVRTENSYVSRVLALQKNYSKPLMNFSRDSQTRIIKTYEVRRLFSNVDAVVPAALAFQEDLQKMWAGGRAAEIIGDLCLDHLKTRKTMDPYRTYISNQDEAQKAFQELYKKDEFRNYVDRTKYHTTGIGNIGLRELLMEPVQRIPRYTLHGEVHVAHVDAAGKAGRGHRDRVTDSPM